MKHYKITLDTSYGEVNYIIEADNESAAEALAEGIISTSDYLERFNCEELQRE